MPPSVNGMNGTNGHSLPGTPRKGGFKPKAKFGLKKHAENGNSHAAGNGKDGTNGNDVVNGAGGSVADEPKILSPSEPKVMIPFHTKAGEVPRQVQIERKKRLYALQDINQLLDERKDVLSEKKVEVANSTLSLELFDNTDYESRNQREWFLGKEHVTHARAAKFDDEDDAIVAWEPCTVEDVKEEDNSYLVCFKSSGEKEWLPRMYVCFQAEDPFQFVKRFVETHVERSKSELQLCYDFYVDNMPTEDIPLLTNEQVNRILVYALNSKKLKDKLMDTSQLINEINIDYARTMNKLVFDVILETNEESRDSAIIKIEEEFLFPPKQLAPESGTVPLPPYDFPEQFSQFSFHSFLTKPEVITAIVKVKSEGFKIQKMNIFNVHYTKSSKLQEFEQAQGQATDQVANQVKETWILTLKNLIRSSFKDVGKGWFNLNEQNQET